MTQTKWIGYVLPSLSRSEARENEVFAQMNQVARAHPFPSCRYQSFFSPSDSKDRGSFFIPAAAPKDSQFGSMMRLLNRTLIRFRVARPPGATSLRTQPPPPPHLTVEKHFVLQPTLCAVRTLSSFLSPFLISLASSYTCPSITFVLIL